MAETRHTEASILPLLGVVFVVLRLCHVIDWSWWVVLAPFWAPFVVLGIPLIVIFVIMLLRR